MKYKVHEEKRNNVKLNSLFKKYFFNFIKIIIGSIALAMGVSLFLLPNQLSSGGFSGIATILYYLFKFPVGTTVFILNIPLFLIAFLKNGKNFFLNALIGTIFLSIFLNIFEKIKPLTSDRFLACIYGGILVGIGTAIVLKANASTGGTDLLASIVKLYKPTIKTGSLIVILDVIIVTINVIFFKELEVGLYSAIAIYIMGKIIDIFFEGINFSKTMYIISDRYEEIAKRIGVEIKRGSTLILAKGMYKNDERNVLMCVASRGEVRGIRIIVNSIDKNAFVIITNAREVFGKGFKTK